MGCDDVRKKSSGNGPASGEKEEGTGQRRDIRGLCGRSGRGAWGRAIHNEQRSGRTDLSLTSSRALGIGASTTPGTNSKKKNACPSSQFLILEFDSSSQQKNSGISTTFILML